jgi:triacylglycerol lipase
MPQSDMPGQRRRPHALATLRTHVNETLSTLREVVLMPRDLGEIVPHHERCGEDVVVLVHGFFASAGVFRPMRKALEEQTGSSVATFTHAPGVGIDRIARSLKRLVARLPRHCRVHLVGHSMGGVVARWYVQEHGGHAHVAQTISLGSPFAGTVRADPFPILTGRELATSSPVLARLRARAHAHDVPHTSIVGERDVVIVPADSAVFPRGDVIVLAHCGHNSLLFDSESIGRVVEKVRGVQAARCEELRSAAE